METTLGDALSRASERLKKAGITGCRNEAEIILAYTMGTERWRLYSEKNEVISPADEKKYDEAISLRAERCPFAYIAGKKEFYGLNFFVSPHVLIPRPETEIVIDTVTELIKKTGKFNDNLKIIDLGTGCGTIAITLAMLFPEASLRAVDISDEALSVAKKNAKFHRVEDRIDFSEGDYWHALDEAGGKFDIIVSNPPYIPQSEILSLAPEIKEYEPLPALNGGRDGLDSYRQILKGIGLYAASPAFLVMETGPEICRAVIDLCHGDSRIASVETISDYGGHKRVVSALII